MSYSSAESSVGIAIYAEKKILGVVDGSLDGIMKVVSKEMKFETETERESNVWMIKQMNAKIDEPYFYIEADHGDRRPRLVFAKGGKMVLTTKDC